jgi:two-component system, OmpR family, phosphate regulon sensor histidine kinase PhoR
MKSASPKVLTFIVAFSLSVLLVVLDLLLAISFDFSLSFNFYLVSFLIMFAVTSFLLKLLQKRYVQDNLLQIYKQIVKIRNPKEAIRPVDENNADISGEINKVLFNWSNDSKEEIDQLKQVETYRREFLSNVSHELKTPVFSVQGYIHTLIDGGIEDPDVNMHYLNKASKGIDRLICMVDDLESISRLESGELYVEKRTFDLKDLAQDVVESVELQAKERGVEVQIEAAENKFFYVFSDKDLVRQVLVNFMVNSIKYGVKEGRTLVRLTELNDKILVDVEDNGIGIGKEHLPRLFERFYRVDKSRSRDQGGTGLGLAIVKHILEALGESVQVDSEPGKGTRFTFSLPRSK